MGATIKDVARAAGVSIKTVSRVLNDERYVGADTRHRVRAAMAALRFSPSTAARTLAGGRSRQVALVCDNPSPYYLFEIQAGVHARCVAAGVRLIVQPYDRASPDVARDIARLIDQARPDGLILTPPVTDDRPVLAMLVERGLPFVRISPGEAGPVSSVHIDNEGAAFDMAAYLAGLGHRRVAFVAGDPAYPTSARRLAGYARAVAELGLDDDPALVRQGRYDFASGAAAADALLALDRPPTAIFAGSDDMAAGVLAAAHRLGVRVPRDLSVAGFDDTALAGYVWPPLTTIRQPTRDLGHAAADLLFAGGGAVEARRLPHALVTRASTAPPLR